MSNHAVDEQGPVSFHRDVVPPRPPEKVDIRFMGAKTLRSFHRVFGKEGAKPAVAEDYKNVFASLHGGPFVDAIMAREVSED